MSNPNMVRVRTEAQEAQRQISYYETLKVRATEKHEAKLAEYDEKIAALELVKAEAEEG